VGGAAQEYSEDFSARSNAASAKRHLKVRAQTLDTCVVAAQRAYRRRKGVGNDTKKG
jgi:hypothetical protein